MYHADHSTTPSMLISLMQRFDRAGNTITTSLLRLQEMYGDKSFMKKVRAQFAFLQVKPAWGRHSLSWSFWAIFKRRSCMSQKPICKWWIYLITCILTPKNKTVHSVFEGRVSAHLTRKTCFTFSAQPSQLHTGNLRSMLWMANNQHQDSSTRSECLIPGL